MTRGSGYAWSPGCCWYWRSGWPAGLSAVAWGVFAVASPVLAFPLAVGVTDPPVLALICLTVALLSRAPVASARAGHGGPGRGVASGAGLALTLGVACAMKATAWPALPVIAAMLTVRDGVRTAASFAPGPRPPHWD